MSLLVVLLIVLLVIVLAGGGYGYHTGYFAGPGYGPYGFGIGGILLLVLIVLLLFGRL